MQAAAVQFPTRDIRPQVQPLLRVYEEVVLVESDTGEQEVPWPVLSLTMGGERAVPSEALVRAQRILERFGPIELECLSGVLPPYDSKANYAISPTPNQHSICSFIAHAVPELEKQGFRVLIDPNFPYQVIGSDAEWYGHVAPRDPDDSHEGNAGRDDWFSLELGIDVEGERINLVPALLDLLENNQKISSLKSLANYPSRYRALSLGQNRYFAMPWERLERILCVLRDMYDASGKNKAAFDFLGALVGGLGRLEQAAEQVGTTLRWSGDISVLARGRELGKSPAWLPEPASLKATLRPYQLQGLSWMEQLRVGGVAGILADDMGLGKTLQTIALLTKEKEARRTDLPSMVIAPTSLIGNWRRELEKFAPHLRVVAFHGPKRRALVPQLNRAEVIVTSYPVLIRDQEALSDLDCHYLILDEAQTIKNARSLAAKAVRQLTSRHRLCLTGTPVENDLGELWALFDFLMPGLLGNSEQFRNRFRVAIEQGGDEESLRTLHARVSPFILRRLKEDVAPELPPKTELVRSVEISGDQRDLYESIRAAAHGEVRKAIKQRGFGASSIAILDALMKLRQVCCDPRLVAVSAARQIEGSAKLEMCLELLERQLASGRRVLLFSQFAKMLALLSRSLTERNIRHLTLTGATQDRQKVVDSFEHGDADVFLISLKAGGTGLNLTSADTVIHYDPWWNAAAQMQATDRAYRIGQTKPVFVYNLIVSGSVEERMLGLQRKKQLLAETLLGSEVASAKLKPDDVDDLFAPLDGE